MPDHEENCEEFEREHVHHMRGTPTSITSSKSGQQQQPWTGQSPQIPSASEAPPPCSTEREPVTETIMLTEIKEEPEDYEEMEMSCNIDDIDDDVDDDDDDDDEEIEEDDSDDNDEDNEDDYEEDDEEEIDETGNNKQEEIAEDNEPSDHLDHMFNQLENMVGNISF